MRSIEASERRACAWFALAAALPAFFATDAQAQDASPRRLAIAVSGGASLGAYEGGFLFSLIEDLRQLSDVVEPRGFFGTSAGAINAFLAVLQTCSPPPDSVETSAFYRTWMPIGFEALFDRRRTQPISALSRSALEAPINSLRKDFAKGLPEACDLLLGVTATRVKPFIVTRAEGRLRLPRMAAQFLLRVEGQGTDRPPRVSNYIGTRDRSLPRLPLDGDDADAFNALLEAILASSAFPFAFAPVEVAHCPGKRSRWKCRPDQAIRDLFLDGGIFDQNPVSIGIEEVGATGTDDARARLYLLDPFQRTYPKPLGSDGGPIEDALSYATKVAAGFVDTARSQRLETLLREDPELERRLIVGGSTYPPFGDLAFYFLSFFEENLRRFDFALGMVESRRALQRAQIRAVLLGDHKAARALEEARTKPSGADWGAYRCVESILGGRSTSPEEIEESCAGEEGALLPLAMVSRERVYDACRRDRWKNPTADYLDAMSQHEDCRLAYDGRRPPGAKADWARASGESELQWVFRRLEAHGYRFADLGPTASADRAFERLRDNVLSCAAEFATAQSTLPGLPRSLARALVNDQVGYRPPQWTLHLALGSPQEVGLSYALGPSPVPWLRATAALDFRGLPTLLSARENYVGVTLTAGLEAELLSLSGPALQVRTGLRGGWLFGSSDDGGFAPCDDPEDPVRPCSRPVLEGTMALHIIDFFRISLTGQFAPATRTNERTLFELRPNLSAQITID